MDAKQKVQQEKGSWTCQIPNVPTLSSYLEAKPAAPEAQILPLALMKMSLVPGSQITLSPSSGAVWPDKDALPALLPTVLPRMHSCSSPTTAFLRPYPSTRCDVIYSI